MANIAISNLSPSGSDLFDDSESYLQELSEQELNLQGGAAISTPFTVTTITTVTITITITLRD
ncbi:MAG TPA: hypothetical protein DDZ80_29370 [Cyanobacteria bacterium UBA8803]|nr:hypothetical protein [Cyanobacteria bacterium UBA9273]HBL62356.1 hypothetical protein [Cyanobacteria bacterium UBA8803]